MLSIGIQFFGGRGGGGSGGARGGGRAGGGGASQAEMDAAFGKLPIGYQKEGTTKETLVRYYEAQVRNTEQNVKFAESSVEQAQRFYSNNTYKGRMSESQAVSRVTAARQTLKNLQDSLERQKKALRAFKKG